MKTAIEARSISYRYDDGPPALWELDFHASRGEFIALLASNGSGKTTLIKMLAGLLKPQAGKVLVEGIPLQDQGTSEDCR